MDSPQRAARTVHEAVGVFHDRDAFLDAVDELMSAGFDRAELNLLAGERAVQQKLGHAYQKVQDLEDDATVPRVAFVGPHSLAEGRTAIIGGLAYLGAVGARLLGRDRAEALKDQLDRGGLLLWVHCRDGEHERRAVEILTRHGAEDVHVHDLPVPEEAEANPLAGLELDPFLPDARF